jgi:hypothetical protein
MEKRSAGELGSDEKAQAGEQIPGKTRFNKERVQQRRYGDLRLLALSGGFFLLYILSLLFQSVESPLMAGNMQVEESVVFASPIIAATAKEQSRTEAAFDESVYYRMVLDNSSDTNPAERTPGQQKE